MKKSICTLFILCACAIAYSQETPQMPDLETTNSQFFDPTKKEKRLSEYTFGVEYRIEVGYLQHNQRSRRSNYPDMFLHGGHIGASFDFLLPIHFSLQTGIFLDLTYGINTQHWRSQDAPTVQTEYLRHKILEAELLIPIRVYYNIPLWKKLGMFFFTGPQFGIGLAQYDFMEEHLSAGTKAWVEQQGYQTAPYDRLAEKELHRFNVQWGLGGGFEWDVYRLQAGYQFGLNNLVRKKVVENQHMWQWGWFVSFCYKFK